MVYFSRFPEFIRAYTRQYSTASRGPRHSARAGGLTFALGSLPGTQLARARVVAGGLELV